MSRTVYQVCRDRNCEHYPACVISFPEESPDQVVHIRSNKPNSIPLLSPPRTPLIPDPALPEWFPVAAGVLVLKEIADVVLGWF